MDHKKWTTNLQNTVLFLIIEYYVLQELGIYYNIEDQKAENMSCDCAIKEVSQSYIIAKWSTTNLPQFITSRGRSHVPCFLFKLLLHNLSSQLLMQKQKYQYQFFSCNLTKKFLSADQLSVLYIEKKNSRCSCAFDKS